MMEELEFEAEMDYEEEWFEEEETYKELEQARGELVIDTKKRRPKTGTAQEIVIIFEDTDGLDEGETYAVSIKAQDIKIGKNDNETGKYKKVGLTQLKGNRFMEYITYNDDEMYPHLTMAFENGYSIEITGEAEISEVNEKPKKTKAKKKT